ncbi:hypothetical protein, partial [Clostridioides difficile]|uniref:hypothetical protein n=1 Tax=Clostridioides difficile TaxID=1496 RepID=UPI00115C5214
ELVSTEGAKQPVEIHAKSIVVEGESDSSYPLQKKRHTLEYLSIKDRVEEAYSLFYGNYFTECNIDLVSDNKDNWDDGLEYK